MNYLQDPNYLEKITKLVKEVLTDEARYAHKNDQNFKFLHDRLFTNLTELNFQEMENDEKLKFRKYFYLDSAITPREDVPFTNSPEDQVFFFQQLRHLIEINSFNFTHTEYVRPGFPEDEKSDQPIFDEDKTNILNFGLIFPFNAALEQHQIAQQEKKNTGKATDLQVPASANPYAGLGQKILLKSQSGQFDSVLTFDQIFQIHKQEGELRRQGLTGAALKQQLLEFINKTFPGLNLFLDDNCQVETFQPKIDPNNPQKVFQPQLINFTRLIMEMKIRQGQDLQYQAINSSKGNLAPTFGTFRIKNADGTVTALHGQDLRVSQNGLGNLVISFARDREGLVALIIADTEDLRLQRQTPVILHLYDDPQTNLPTDHKIKLNSQQLQSLIMPLRQLYQILKQKEDEQKNVELGPKPFIPQPGQARSLEGTAIPNDQPSYQNQASNSQFAWQSGSLITKPTVIDYQSSRQQNDLTQVASTQARAIKYPPLTGSGTEQQGTTIPTPLAQNPSPTELSEQEQAEGQTEGSEVNKAENNPSELPLLKYALGYPGAIVAGTMGFSALTYFLT